MRVIFETIGAAVRPGPWTSNMAGAALLLLASHVAYSYFGSPGAALLLACAALVPAIAALELVLREGDDPCE